MELNHGQLKFVRARRNFDRFNIGKRNIGKRLRRAKYWAAIVTRVIRRDIEESRARIARLMA